MNRKRVLICPLEWGLGHATRCIPVIRQLLYVGAEVLIAADGGPLALLKDEFPQLTFIKLKGYNIHYSGRIPMTISMLLQSPKILFNILREHNELKRIIREHEINCIVSDNRFGLWNKSVYTIFITHQLRIKCPPSMTLFEPALKKFNYYFIKKYNECWIPDSAGENNLSGDLSHGVALPANAVYIGLLSRFTTLTEKEACQKKYDLLAVISGPEPHRSIFLERILHQLKNTTLCSLIVTGEPHQQQDVQISDNIRLVSHLNAQAMKQAIMQSETVICRAGYSSIMDLVTLRKKAILVPTPGQTEQEYLARHLNEKRMFYTVAEKEFVIEKALREVNNFNFSESHAEVACAHAVKQLIEKLPGIDYNI